jgi:hypothetical protein
MIDRKALVRRNNPVITRIEPLSPLSIGNHEFAFTADFTGLQTFPESYEVPLGTQSTWGWHSTVAPGYYTYKDLELQAFDTYGRQVYYPVAPGARKEAYHWLRQNPHRLHLGRLSFLFYKENGDLARVTDVEGIRQELDLWEGCLHSAFTVEGRPVQVTTVVHPENDEVAVKVVSDLIKEGRLQVLLEFPAPDMLSDKWEEAIDLDWEHHERHRTEIIARNANSLRLLRSMDQDRYEVAWSWRNGEFRGVPERWAGIRPGHCHEFLLAPLAAGEFTFTVAFAPTAAETSGFTEARELAKKHWTEFWRSGGAVDFSGSKDPRAPELERRVVLSQYLTAVHCGGSLPPQETGLMYNSWYGKFHLEMHWWHAAHFPLWGRVHLLEKSLWWYRKILPKARALAAAQGYAGARWPKTVGPDGEQSPSPISPLLIWEQPHPVIFAELCYRAHPDRATLEKYKEIVFASAAFMVSYTVYDPERDEYLLGPPLIPAQENHKPEESINPTFELEYWRTGLEVAVAWAERLRVLDAGTYEDARECEIQGSGAHGSAAMNPEKWKEVAAKIAKPPHKDGVYLAHENCPETFSKYNQDHPSMVGAMGVLPGKLIDPEIMRNTLKRVWSDWQWETAWGWDFPMCAMTAARLGERALAVEFLLMETPKNTYLPNGHNYQYPGLSAYLPGNGGLLTAVAMMTAGWRGLERPPGRPDRTGPQTGTAAFPDDGSWSVQWEGLYPLL